MAAITTRDGAAAGESPATDEAALRQIFLDARTHNKWQPKDVSDDLLHQLVDVLKLGPTSANCSPARFIFVKSKEAKEWLKPHLSEGNREKMMQAPVRTIVGYDVETSTCGSSSRTRMRKAGSSVSRRKSRRQPSATALCKGPT